MGRGERREPMQRLESLSFRRDGTTTVALVGGDDDVHQTLEEVTLVDGASAPRELELLVRGEELTRLRECQALLVGPAARC